MDINLYTFRKKRFTDGRGLADEAYMVLVGRYFYRHDGGQNAQYVWARATGLVVNFYHSHSNTAELTPVEFQYINRIYFMSPFIYVSGAQDKGVNKARRYGLAVTETFINFLFLSRRLLVHVYNEKSRDMLEDFGHACVNFDQRRRAEQELQRIKVEKFDTNEKEQAHARGFGPPILPEGYGPPYVKQEMSDGYEQKLVNWLGKPFDQSSASYYTPKVKRHQVLLPDICSQ